MAGNPTPGPVVTAATVQAILAALVTLGWVSLDNVGQATVATGIAALLAVVATGWARARVTPVRNPVGADGAPLVPAASSTAAPPTSPPPDGEPSTAPITVQELLGRHALRERR